MATAARVGSFPADVQMDGKVLGIRSQVGEDLIAVSYLRLKNEGSLVRFFHSNPTISLREFLDWHQNPKQTYLGCFMSPILDKPKWEMAGAGYINQIKTFEDAAIAEVGEYFHRGTSPKTALQFGKMLVDFCFYCKNFSVIYGVTPVQNRAALMYAKRLGFTLTEPLPRWVGWGGYASDGVISYIKREDWIAREKA